MGLYDRIRHDSRGTGDQQDRSQLPEGRRVDYREVHPREERQPVGISQVDYASGRKGHHDLRRQPQRLGIRGAMMRTRVALGIVLTVSVLLTAGAQAQFFGGPPPYTPAAGAKDLRAVLFNWTSYMGMLRGIDEHELIVSLEYQGKGTIQVDGQPCTLTKYRVSTNYQTPGQRVQYTCTRPNGQTYSGIEVVSGQYAWNEDIPGAEIIPGKGKATPMPNAVQERLIRLWAGPQAALKAALAGAGIPLSAMERNPGQLLAGGVAKLHDTSVAWKGGKP